MKRRGRDSNPRYTCVHTGFRDRPDRPLRHLSGKRPSTNSSERCMLQQPAGSRAHPTDISERSRNDAMRMIGLDDFDDYGQPVHNVQAEPSGRPRRSFRHNVMPQITLNDFDEEVEAAYRGKNPQGQVEETTTIPTFCATESVRKFWPGRPISWQSERVNRYPATLGRDVRFERRGVCIVEGLGPCAVLISPVSRSSIARSKEWESSETIGNTDPKIRAASPM